MNFQYDFRQNKKSDIEYNYDVKADLIGIVESNNDKNKEVWTRNFALKEKSNYKLENDYDFLVNENVDIDYEYYNNLARSYENTYDITINTILKVYFNINIEDMKIGNKINDYIEIDIPITNTVTEVKENYDTVTKKEVLQNREDVKKEKNIIIIISIVLITGGIILIIFRIIQIYRNQRKDMYSYNINHILKYYKDLIVSVKNKPNISDLKLMEIDYFDDLIDVAEQNQTNIIFYEEKNKKGNLYVIVDKYVYQYKITSNKLK